MRSVYAVFKINGRPVATGDQELGWTIKFVPRQVKIIVDYIRREIFQTFWATKRKFSF